MRDGLKQQNKAWIFKKYVDLAFPQISQQSSNSTTFPI